MKKAIIIGAGPAGLTAAFELLKRTDIIPIVLEKSEYMGGISRTIDYKGNRMDMGPHRFFSKSDRVMDWWLNIMPLESNDTEEKIEISYQNKSRTLQNTPEMSGSPSARKKMLIIPRLTRIYFLRQFFAYPIQLSIETLKTLGIVRTIRILLSFLWIRIFPRKPEKSLEDFIINKFGKELYFLFFKDYTEKVWGVPCKSISAEWGAQRIKGVSLSKAILQAVKSVKSKGNKDISQKNTETSLIEQFLYPKYGPGSLWEEVASQVQSMGGKIYLNQDVKEVYTCSGQVCSVHTINNQTGELQLHDGDYFFSTMPVQELIADMGNAVPDKVKNIAEGLQYRDFINVGILLKQMSKPDGSRIELKDNWIYIQERDIKAGRLMIYNNWGDGMIHDASNTWIGMEYFCNKTDDFWGWSDEEVQRFAINELIKMELANVDDILDSTVRRMEKTYPAYFGTYAEFDSIREYTDQFTNLFLIGRNGMHKYNNADHSMLTAMVSVDNIEKGILTKENIWSINTEQEYHEEKQIAKENVSTETSHLIPEPSFISFLWTNRWNRTYLYLSMGTLLLMYLFLKILYPFANYMPDSYYYLQAAASNTDVNIWPVAYSKFLRFLSVFTHSDKILVFVQYLLIQTASITFLMSVLYFLQPHKTIKKILCIFFAINPITLFIANYISADAIFISCSLIWLTILIWIIYRPKTWLIPIHAIALLLCFAFRYNAIYYPVISALVFLLTKQKHMLWRLAGLSAGLSLVFFSIWYTSGKMKEITGQRQFSAFGGWQLANNALYMYEHIPSSKRPKVPTKFQQLETMVRQHMDTLSKVKLTKKDSINSYFYLWSGRGPLIQYMLKQWDKDSVSPYFKRWATEGPLYLDYGKYLISQYPGLYMEAFLLPNTIKYFSPPAEFLGTYNMGDDSVNQFAKDWFNYKTKKVASNAQKDKSYYLAGGYSVLFALTNILMFICLISLLTTKSLRKTLNVQWKTVLLVGTIWCLNAAFSIAASPIVLRYQIFPFIICLGVGLITSATIYGQLKMADNKTINKPII